MLFVFEFILLPNGLLFALFSIFLNGYLIGSDWLALNKRLSFGGFFQSILKGANKGSCFFFRLMECDFLLADNWMGYCLNICLYFFIDGLDLSLLILNFNMIRRINYTKVFSCLLILSNKKKNKKTSFEK